MKKGFEKELDQKIEAELAKRKDYILPSFITPAEERELLEILDQCKFELSPVPEGDGNLGQFFSHEVAQRLQEARYLQTELDSRLRLEDGGLPAVYESTKLRVQKLFGKKRISDKELFERQIQNVGSLTDSLEQVIGYSKNVLSGLQRVYEKRVIETELNVTGLVESEYELNRKQTLYTKAKEELGSMRFGKGLGFAMIKLRRMERQIRDTAHVRTLYRNSIRYNLKESKLIDGLELGFDNSTKLCEYIYHEARKIKRTADDTYRVYLAFLSQQETASALYDQLTDLGTMIDRTYGLAGTAVIALGNYHQNVSFEKVFQGRGNKLAEFLDRATNLEYLELKTEKKDDLSDKRYGR